MAKVSHRGDSLGTDFPNECSVHFPQHLPCAMAPPQSQMWEFNSTAHFILTSLLSLPSEGRVSWVPTWTKTHLTHKEPLDGHKFWPLPA